MDNFVTSKDGTQIGYDLVGEGPAVILVAGVMQFRAFDSNTVEMANELAARGFTVINFDRRGRGASMAAPSFTLDDSIEDIRSLIELAELAEHGDHAEHGEHAELADPAGRPVALFGNSSGAAISLAAAAAGLDVSALILWEAPLGPELGSDGSQNLQGLRQKLGAGNPDAVIEYFMKDMPAQWLEGAKSSPAWPVMTQMGPSLEADSEALAWTQSAPRKDLWAAISVPVLALIGEQTIPIMPPAAQSIASNVLDGQMASIPGENHGWQPKVMATRIAEFLS